MEQDRTIQKVITGKAAIDGAGVHLVRIFGYDDTKDFDPFLMLDSFDSTNPDDYVKGFPWHPHRGIETITYLIHGNIEHGDSLGNKGTILDGDFQWMTAGSGIIHQEMPKATQRILGVQLWLNMPAAHKMEAPKYHGFQRWMIPAVKEETVKIHVISGKYKDTEGAMQGEYVKPTFLDVEINPNASWLLETDPEDNLFVYVCDGSAIFEKNSKMEIGSKHVILFEHGKQLEIHGGNEGVRFLLLAGKPLEEPIAWGGPIVMNTQEELDLAMRELNNNTFVK